jgi:uncharacterized membrane protein YccF (DUF307 family)
MALNTQTEKNTSIQVSSNPGCLIQALWFIFIGWWLGALSIVTAWLLNITIIGLPLGLAILNNIPRILSLQSPGKKLQVIQSNGTTAVSSSTLPQRNFLFRAIYFILIGWWWSAVWLIAAYLLCITVILIPLSLQMFRLTPFMTTLKRY